MSGWKRMILCAGSGRSWGNSPACDGARTDRKPCSGGLKFAVILNRAGRHVPVQPEAGTVNSRQTGAGTTRPKPAGIPGAAVGRLRLKTSLDPT